MPRRRRHRRRNPPLSRLPIFWQFVGLSTPGRLSSFRFLKRLDKLGNTYVDNCGFFEPGDGRNPSTLYRGLLNELPDYIRRPEVQEMLRPPELGGLETRGYREQFEDEDAQLDALTAMPHDTDDPESEPDYHDEPEPEHDLDALRQKFAGIEWVEGTHGGAVRSAAPVKVREEVENSLPSRRRVRPSELENETPSQPQPKDDPRQRVAERLARLKSSLTEQVEPRAPVPTPPPRPAPLPRPPAPPPRPVATAHLVAPVSAPGTPSSHPAGR